MTAQHLIVDIRSYWHPGGGRGRGMVLDAAAHRASDGLPALPGRHLKGLLREALEMAQHWQWPGYEGLSARLFGARSGDPGAEGGVPAPGCLRVSDARLPSALADYLRGPPGSGLVPGLFRALYATAVEHESGSARDKSLRGIEVIVPMQVVARIEPIPGREAPPGDWPQRLGKVLPLVPAVGAHRSRGLGRAVLSLEDAP